MEFTFFFFVGRSVEGGWEIYEGIIQEKEGTPSILFLIDLKVKHPLFYATASLLDSIPLVKSK